MVTDFVVVPPALVAEQVQVLPESSVSVVTTDISHPLEEVIGDSSSVVFQLTATSLVYQPSSPSVPTTLGVTVGGVLSCGAGVLTVIEKVDGLFVHLLPVLPPVRVTVS